MATHATYRHRPLRSHTAARLTGRLACLQAAAAGVAAACWSAAADAQTNVPVAATGYTQDVVLETASPTSAGPIGFDMGGADFYLAGLVSGTTNSSSYGSGLPVNGSIASAAAGTSTRFQLQPYTGPNTLLLANAYNLRQPAGTLTLSTPAAYTSLAFCEAATSGAQTIAYTLNFTDGTSAAGSFTALDWFTGGTTAALTGIGRAFISYNPVRIDTTTQVGSATLYEYDVPASVLTAGNQGKIVRSVTFTDAAATFGSVYTTGIFAVSGAVNPSVTTLTRVFTGRAGGAVTGAFDTTTPDFAAASGGSSVAFANGNAVVFDDTAAAGSTALTVPSAGVVPFGVAFNNSTAAYTVSGGPIGGLGGLAVNGTGSVALANANTYPAGTAVNAGTLTVAGGGSVTTPTVTVAAGATLAIAAGGSITSPTVTVAAGGSFTIAAGGQPSATPFNLADNGTATFTSAARALTALTGSGTLNLNGTALTVGAGTTFTGTIAGTGGVTYTAPTVVTAADTYAGGTTFGNGSNVTFGGPFAFGTGPLNFAGGTLTPTGPLTGTAALTAPYSFGAVPTATFNSANAVELAGVGTLAPTSTFNVAGAGSLTLSGGFAGSGGLVKLGAGGLFLTSPTAALTGVNVSGGTLTFTPGSLGSAQVNLSGGTLRYAAGNTTDLTTTGGLALNAPGGTLDTNGNDVTFANPILVGADYSVYPGGFTKAGTGTLTLRAGIKSSYCGGINVSGGSVVFGPAAAYPTPTVVANAGSVVVGTQANAPAGLTLTGAAALTGSAVYAGYNNASSGVVTVRDSATLTVSTLTVGPFGTADGTVSQTGGTVQVPAAQSQPGDWRIGGSGGFTDAGTSGAYNLSGGTVDTYYAYNYPYTTNVGVFAANVSIGAYGYGTWTQTGGSFVAGAAVEVGQFSTGTGVMTVTGGTVTQPSPYASKVYVGNAGNGTVTVGGTGAIASPGGVVVAAAAGSVGTLNLNAGGTLTVPSVAGGAGAGTANFNGGTLVATASTNAFVQGLAVANVAAGGLTVDTGAFAVGLPQPLSHDTTRGAPATDGGLTKLGTGTLTLSGASSYAGGTRVVAGTVVATTDASLGTGPVTLAGGTLRPGNSVPAVVNGFGQFTYGVNSSGLPAGAAITPTTFQLNATASAEAGTSSFIPFAVDDARTFSVSFTYNHGAAAVAGGVSGTLIYGFQNDPRGTALTSGVGTNGYVLLGDAGYPSEVGYVDLYGGASGAIGFASGGAAVGTATADARLFQTSSQVITLTYNGPTRTLTQTVAYTDGTADTSSVAVDLAAVLGGAPGGAAAGYFGFAGGSDRYGGATTQSITGLTYTGFVNQPATLANAVTAAAAVTSTLSLTTAAGQLATTVGPLTIAPGSRLNVTVPPNGTAAPVRAALVVAGLNVSGGALDLGGNDLVVRNGSLAAVTAAVAAGSAGGPAGVVSSAAAANTSRLTMLGVIQNSVDGTTTGTPLYGSFDTAVASATDVLVKYTYYGDTNLDGVVNGLDYALIDAGFISQSTGSPLTGWYNGDFNYDGNVDASDYTLIDNAFNTQAASGIGSPTSMLANSTAEVAPAAPSTVPEPATAGLLAVGAAATLRRRRRRFVAGWR